MLQKQHTKNDMKSGTVKVSTSAQMQLVDITDQLRGALSESGVREGIFYAYNPHTTAGLTINEGADPAVRHDIIEALKQIVPLDHPYRHMEGNSPAHIMTTLTGSSITVFVESGRLQLGTWQHIFLAEYDGPRTRKIHWKIVEG